MEELKTKQAAISSGLFSLLSLLDLNQGPSD